MTVASDATQALITAIQQGACDNGLDLIGTALKDRRAAIALQTVAGLEPGDRVKLDNLSPKYFIGLEGEVKAVESRWVIVQLDRWPRQAVRFSNPLKVPFGSVKRA
jgi:hypothetical protein